MRAISLALLLMVFMLVSCSNPTLMPTPSSTPDPGAYLTTLRQQADRSIQEGNYDAAVTSLQDLAALDPANAVLRFELALMLAATQPEAALPHLQQAAEGDPAQSEAASTILNSIRTASLAGDQAYTLLISGRALAAQGEWALAGEAFRRATLARPDYAEAWAFLGEARQHAPEYAPSQALEALKIALALEPGLLSAHTLLALYWQRQGEFTEALRVLETAAGLYPENPAVQAELGNARALAGDLKGGIAAHQRAVALAPADPTYYRYLAEYALAYETRVQELALPAARQAVSIDPDDPQSLTVLGQVLLRLNDLDNAQRILLRALRSQPGFAPALTQLGLVYALQGDIEMARDYWEEVQQQAPGSQAAIQASRLLENYSP